MTDASASAVISVVATNVDGERTQRGSTIAAAPANPPMTTTSARAARSGRRENRPIDERSRSLQRSDPGIVASTPTLSWGQARTQSRQNVQSMFPAFCGRYKSSSHPRCWALPRRQSWVTQVAQTLRSFSRTSNGETSELTNWNCPMGQTYLQKLAPRNSVSTTKAPTK